MQFLIASEAWLTWVLNSPGPSKYPQMAVCGPKLRVFRV